MPANRLLLASALAAALALATQTQPAPACGGETCIRCATTADFAPPVEVEPLAFAFEFSDAALEAKNRGFYQFSTGFDRCSGTAITRRKSLWREDELLRQLAVREAEIAKRLPGAETLPDTNSAPRLESFDTAFSFSSRVSPPAIHCCYFIGKGGRVAGRGRLEVDRLLAELAVREQLIAAELAPRATSHPTNGPAPTATENAAGSAHADIASALEPGADSTDLDAHDVAIDPSAHAATTSFTIPGVNADVRPAWQVRLAFARFSPTSRRSATWQPLRKPTVAELAILEAPLVDFAFSFSTYCLAAVDFASGAHCTEPPGVRRRSLREDELMAELDAAEKSIEADMSYEPIMGEAEPCDSPAPAKLERLFEPQPPQGWSGMMLARSGDVETQLKPVTVAAMRFEDEKQLSSGVTFCR